MYKFIRVSVVDLLMLINNNLQPGFELTLGYTVSTATQPSYFGCEFYYCDPQVRLCYADASYV